MAPGTASAVSCCFPEAPLSNDGFDFMTEQEGMCGVCCKWGATVAALARDRLIASKPMLTSHVAWVLRYISTQICERLFREGLGGLKA